MAAVPPRLRPDFMADCEPVERVRAAVLKIDLTEESVGVRLRHEAASNNIDHLAGRTNVTDQGVDVAIPIWLKHRQGATIIEPPETATSAGRIDRALVRAIALASSWSGRLACGKAASLTALATADGYCAHYAARLLPLAWLAPDIIEAIIAGRQPKALSLGALTKHPLPVSWEEQRILIDHCGRRRS